MDYIHFSSSPSSPMYAELFVAYSILLNLKGKAKPE